jgi:predicted nuclease with TOPRIM domain
VQEVERVKTFATAVDRIYADLVHLNKEQEKLSKRVDRRRNDADALSHKLEIALHSIEVLESHQAMINSRLIALEGENIRLSRMVYRCNDKSSVVEGGDGSCEAPFELEYVEDKSDGSYHSAPVEGQQGEESGEP